MAAVGPVAVVAEDGRHGAHRVDDAIRRHEAQGGAQTGEGVLLLVGHAEAAAHQDVGAHQLAVFHHGHQSHVLGVDVHGVVVGQGDGGLELPR